MIVEGGSPTPEEAAAILAAIEAALAAAPHADGVPAAPPWRIAARLPGHGIDALRRARDAWHLTRLR